MIEDVTHYFIEISRHYLQMKFYSDYSGKNESILMGEWFGSIKTTWVDHANDMVIIEIQETN